MSKEMSKRQMRREQIKRKERNSRMLAIGLITLGALVVGGLFVWSAFKPVGNIVTPTDISRPNADFNAAGDPNAPIKITEFSDFQCPYCRLFFENTEALLMEQYVAPGTVYFIYRSVGGFIGPESQAAAEAAYCAGDQGKFWQMHDMLFTNQGGENTGTFSDRRLSAFADKIGLDSNQFSDCFNTGKYKSTTEKDSTDATAAGVKATPSFFLNYTVNGELQTKLIEGAQTIDVFKQNIDAALAELGK